MGAKLTVVSMCTWHSCRAYLWLQLLSSPTSSAGTSKQMPQVCIQQRLWRQAPSLSSFTMRSSVTRTVATSSARSTSLCLYDVCCQKCSKDSEKLSRAQTSALLVNVGLTPGLPTVTVCRAQVATVNTLPYCFSDLLTVMWTSS